MGRSPHLPRFGRETERDLAIVERAMDLANVSHIADRPITEISGGERQRAFIAMCLAQEPQVLLLDEPTSHLDIGHQLSILNLIRNLNRQTRMTVVAVFHDLNLAAEYCDRLVLLDQGRIVAAGTPVDVLTTEMILNVYGVERLSSDVILCPAVPTLFSPPTGIQASRANRRSRVTTDEKDEWEARAGKCLSQALGPLPSRPNCHAGPWWRRLTAV